MINSPKSAGALVLLVVANPKDTVHCSQRSCNLATVEFRRAMVYSSQSPGPVILAVVANPNDTVPGPQSQAVWLKFWQLNLWSYCLHPGPSTAQVSTAESVGVFVKSTTGPCGVPSIWCASTNPLVVQGHRGAICGGYNLRLLSLVFEVQDATSKSIVCKRGRFGGHKGENVKQGRAEIQKTIWCRSTSQVALPCEHRRMFKVEGECRRNTRGNRRVTFEVLMEPSQTDGAGPRGPTPVVTNERLVFVLSGGAQCALFVPPCPVLPADRQAGGRQARRARGHHQQQRTPQRHRERAERRGTTKHSGKHTTAQGKQRGRQGRARHSTAEPPARADATIS